MWQLHYRYHTTEGSHDEYYNQTFNTLEAAIKEALDYVDDDLPRVPARRGDVSVAVASEYGHWYTIPPENTTQVEVPLILAHLHSHDDKVLFVAKKV